MLPIPSLNPQNCREKKLNQNKNKIKAKKVTKMNKQTNKQNNKQKQAINCGARTCDSGL